MPEPPWQGTLLCDQYAGYNAVLDTRVYPQRKAAACAAHARRKFEELSRGGPSASALASDALQRFGADLSSRGVARAHERRAAATGAPPTEQAALG